jgi:hypothetical protein
MFKKLFKKTAEATKVKSSEAAKIENLNEKEMNMTSGGTSHPVTIVREIDAATP